jgi:hypothetical protein
MARANKGKAGLQLIELQVTVIQHCHALKRVVRLLQEKKIPAAVAAIEGAVVALEASLRSQASGEMMMCPACGTHKEVIQWVDESTCDQCGQRLGPLNYG